MDKPRSQPKLARLLATLSIAAILFCGLFPFDLDFRGASGRISRRFDTSFAQFFTSGDSFENILFFVPLGFAIGAILPRFARRDRETEALSALAALVAGAALSTLVETLQCLLAERDPSLTDVVNNTIGAVAGYALHFFFGRQAMRATAQAIDRTQRRSGVVTLSLLSLSFIAIVCAAPLILGADAGSLATWNPSYVLATGNEIGAKRDWEGRVWDVAIASRAATPAQVAWLLDGAEPHGILGQSLIAQYDLRGEPPFIDRAQSLPPLALASRVGAASTQPRRAPATIAASHRRPTTSFGSPVSTRSSASPMNPATTQMLLPTAPADAVPWQQSLDTWLRTTYPVDVLVDPIARSHQFTVAFKVSTDRVDQQQDARILTISAGALARNLTFAQDGTNLTVRVRTGATGDNGAAPRFIMPGVFFDSSPRNVIATFADSTLRVYVDRPAWVESVRLTPEATAIWKMYPRSDWTYQLGRGDAAIAATIYRAAAFLGIGILVAATVNTFRRQHRERLLIAGSAIAVTIVLFEGLIGAVGGQRLHLADAIVSALFAAIGVMVIKIRKGLSFA